MHAECTEKNIALAASVDTSEADKLHRVWTTRISMNSVSRQSSTRGTEEVEGVEDDEEDEVEDEGGEDGGDAVMTGIEPGTSASTAVKKRKRVAKVREPLVAIALLLTCF